MASAVALPMRRPTGGCPTVSRVFGTMFSGNRRTGPGRENNGFDEALRLHQVIGRCRRFGILMPESGATEISLSGLTIRVRGKFRFVPPARRGRVALIVYAAASVSAHWCCSDQVRPGACAPLIFWAQSATVILSERDGYGRALLEELSSERRQ